MKVKVCGLTDAKQVSVCVKNNADFCGFILNYSKSHRFVNYEKAKILTKIKKNNTSYVGVLVNPNDEELDKYSKLNIDYFQIYGKYSPEKILDIKSKFNKKVIIALQVKNKKDVSKYKLFEKVADIILWDSSGLEKSLSWNYDWIKSIPENIIKMIAGNIDLYNLKKISSLADIVDVSGALETNKVKDIDKIKKFLNEVKKLDD
jgi:phosphoribosylanthranilate isomerase